MSEATTGVIGGERLGEHHPEALAAERGRAQHVGAAQLGGLLALGDLAERVHPTIVEQQWRDLLGAGADEGERGGHVLAQRLEGAQQHRQTLALDGLTDEQDAQRRRSAVGSALTVSDHAPRAREGRASEAASGRCTPLGTIR